MGRFALIVGAIAVGVVVLNPGLVDLGDLQDKLLLVALLPGVYVLGLALLND